MDSIREKKYLYIALIVIGTSPLGTLNVMSYVNYWSDDDQVINLNFGVHKYLSCSQLAKHLDFDNFLFYNDSHDGFYEFAKDKNMIADDGFHPTLQAHIEWADFIREKL